MMFVDHPTRNLFFTGKGGVGKTTVACATAVRLAELGKQVLVVSTDPASNLDEVLGVTLGNCPTVILGVPNLFAMNLDPTRIAEEYRERMVGPYRGVLPDEVLRQMEEQYSGACTVEMAVFGEFSRLLSDRTSTAQFDHILFDTAPTGHTLRLLSLASAWDGFIQENTTGTSCLGPLTNVRTQQKSFQESVTILGDPARTTLVIVTRAEPIALREAARTCGELAELGVQNQHLVINGVLRAFSSEDPFAVAIGQREAASVAAMPNVLKSLPHTTIPLFTHGILGIDSLRRLGSEECSSSVNSCLQHSEQILRQPLLRELIDDLVAPGCGVILAMGKGGVGKTTVAAAVAVAIAQRGYDVHISTTDPAAHVTATLNNETLPNLTVSRIDPSTEVAKYSAEVLRKMGNGLDAKGRALLEENLRSPCTEEIAVFRAFAQAVSAGTRGFVVLDTAPTGHTVLLLDSALAYHREVTRQSGEIPEAIEQLLPRLRDPSFTRVLLVTLPAATPVHEAATLQSDLRRAEIEPFAWVVNQVLSAVPFTDPQMIQRQTEEQKYLREVQDLHANRLAFIPWQAQPPIGLEGLIRLVNST